MQDGPYAGLQQPISERATEITRNASKKAMDLGRVVLTDLKTWEPFRWILLALLAANILLAALLYGGIKSEIAELRQDRDSLLVEITNLRTEMAKQIAETKAGLTQALSAMQSGLKDEIAKTNAKLEKAAAPPPAKAEPAPKPKPKRRR